MLYFSVVLLYLYFKVQEFVRQFASNRISVLITVLESKDQKQVCFCRVKCEVCAKCEV